MYFISGLIYSYDSETHPMGNEYFSFCVGYVEYLENAYKMIKEHGRKLYSAFNYIVIEEYSQGYCPIAKNKIYFDWDELHTEWKEVNKLSNLDTNNQWCFLNNL